MLQNQKQEKDQKLKGQIRKNEELLGELQELSEAVHALKNDKSFSASAQILEEREEVIQHYHHYLSNNQKRSLDRVFSTILKAVESIRQFSQIHKIDDEKYYSLFEMMDKSLKNIANSQKK